MVFNAVHEDNDVLSDDRDRTTSRAGSFIAPIGESDVLDVRITGLLSAADEPAAPGWVTAVLRMFKALGLELGKQWNRSDIDPILLKQMARAATDIPNLLNIVPFGQPNQKRAYDIGAIIACVGLTANTRKEAVYFDDTLDNEGNPLTGVKKYTMTFKQMPPFIELSFSAWRMFDATNSYPVPNPLNRYVLETTTQI